MAAANANAEITSESGNDLYSRCINVDSRTAVADDFMCFGYVSGVADAMVANNNEIAGFRECLRVGLTRLQLSDVVEKWLQNHPEKRDFSAPGLVAHAFAEAFPCSQ
jgi:hypothetical protein